MTFTQILLFLLPLSTLTLGVPVTDPAADPVVNDAAKAQSPNLQKRVIIPYMPHVRCLVKKKGQKGVIDYERSWGITAGCCFGCSKALSGKNCEQFCDPRVGTCCQLGDVESSGFGACCRGSAAQGAYDPHVEKCDPAPYWPPGRNNCKNKRSVIENAMYDYDELDYEVDIA
ncbi:hypothetical protein BKA80DRAFT_258355 [Phyllosticta citrichinensis]